MAVGTQQQVADFVRHDVAQNNTISLADRSWSQPGFVDMAKRPVLASQFRPVAQSWLERYLDTVEVSGSSPLGPTRKQRT